MSRYEKINYDELEMLASVGGVEGEVLPKLTKNAVCKITKMTVKVSVALTKAICPIPKSIGKTCAVVEPIEMKP